MMMVMATGERRVGRKGSEGVRGEGEARSDRIRRGRDYIKMAPEAGSRLDRRSGAAAPSPRHARGNGTGGEDLS